MSRTNGNRARSYPKLLLALRNKSAMSRMEVTGALCVPELFRRVCFRRQRSVSPTAGGGSRFRRPVHVLRLGQCRVRAHPTSITLTTAWQRFKITGTLAGGQTGLWIVVRQFAGNGDNWTSGAIYLWGACLQQGNDPKSGYARTWASQTASVAAGVACGATVIAAKDTAESLFRIYGPGSNLADHRLLEVTAGGELILAGGIGNGYRLAELTGATNPSGWSGVLKVKTPSGVTAGYILLYSNP